MTQRAIFSVKTIEGKKRLYWMLPSDADYRNLGTKDKNLHYIKVADGKAVPKSKTICNRTRLSAIVIQGADNKKYYRYSDYSLAEIV